MKNKKINIGIVGLGHIGGRLYKEILSKKRDIYLHRLSGISNSIFKKKSWYRPRIDDLN